MVDAFERRLASVPRLDAFTAAAGASACCFGGMCKHSGDASLAQIPCVVCTEPLHHVCASEHPFLKPFYSKFESDNICFNCSLLVAIIKSEHRSAPPVRSSCLSRTTASCVARPCWYPHPLGSALCLSPSHSSLSSRGGAHCTRARALPHIAKCVTCKSSEGELRACSFCKSGIYHNTLACLAVERSPATSLMHKAFPWCCPKCFKKGKLALDKTLLGPSPTTRKRGR